MLWLHGIGPEVSKHIVNLFVVLKLSDVCFVDLVTAHTIREVPHLVHLAI